MNRKFVRLGILVLAVIIQGCSGARLLPTEVPTPTTSPTVPDTATVTTTPTLAPTLTLRPTSTATPLPTWVTNFAEPILASIKDREPDFQEDFSTDTQSWLTDRSNKKLIAIENGVMRLQGDIHVWNNYFLYKPNIVLQVDILEPVSPSIIIVLSSQASPYNTFGDLQLNNNLEWLVWGEYYAISARGKYSPSGQKTRITIIIKDGQAAYYLNDIPLAFYENPKLIYDEKHQRRLVCSGDDNICYFDNVKVWNLDHIPNQP